MSDDDEFGGIDMVAVGGGIHGRKVGSGAESGSIGTLMAGRSANEQAISAALRYWPRSYVDDYEEIEPRIWADVKTGLVYERILSDPLAGIGGGPGQTPEALCSTFCVHGDRLVFLRLLPQTLAERAAEQVRQAREVEKEAERSRRWRSKQKLGPVLAHEAFGSSAFPALSIRQAAERLVGMGGTISIGAHGEIDVRIPELVTGDALSEGPVRAELVAAARVIVYSDAVVRKAIAAAGSDVKKLIEKLPDAPPTLGGGIS